MLRRELDVFLTALMFFTRVPVPRWANYTYDPIYLQQSSRYFALIGWLVGGVGALAYLITALWLPPLLAILLSLCATILFTGAFHEDGWADVCDGFGGGMTKTRVLTIMKDSRLGTYGTLGLICLLALKVGALHTLAPSGLIPLILLASHAVSRFAATTLIYTHEYVRENEDSKAKPLATAINTSSLAFCGVCGLLPLLLLSPVLWWALIAVMGVTIVAARWFQRRIGGYTGDCLGTVQQLTEVAFYLTVVGLLA